MITAQEIKLASRHILIPTHKKAL